MPDSSRLRYAISGDLIFDFSNRMAGGSREIPMQRYANVETIFFVARTHVQSVSIHANYVK